MIPSSAPSQAPSLRTRCGCPTCTDEVLQRIATDFPGNSHSCEARIDHLVRNSLNENDACVQVANVEFPTICGWECDPLTCGTPPSEVPSQAPSETIYPTQVPSPAPARCGCSSCTTEVLQRIATDFPRNSHSCEARIDHLVRTGLNEHDACVQVANVEFPSTCGWECDPLTCDTPPSEIPSQAPSKSVAPSETVYPTDVPSQAPSKSVAPSETVYPTDVPSQAPSKSVGPSETAYPTDVPSQALSKSVAPSETVYPTEVPSNAPSKSVASSETVYPTAGTVQVSCFFRNGLSHGGSFAGTVQVGCSFRNGPSHGGTLPGTVQDGCSFRNGPSGRGSLPGTVRDHLYS